MTIIIKIYTISIYVILSLVSDPFSKLNSWAFEQSSYEREIYCNSESEILKFEIDVAHFCLGKFRTVSFCHPLASIYKESLIYGFN